MLAWVFVGMYVLAFGIALARLIRERGARHFWRDITERGDLGEYVQEASLCIGHSLVYEWPEAFGHLLRAPSRYGVLAHACAALMLLALPQTRAIAKVRPVHVARAGAYALALNGVLLFGGIAMERFTEHFSMPRFWSQVRTGSGWLEAFILPAALVWGGWWWWEVCRTYLRLPRPFLVWVIVVGVSLFAAAVAKAWLDAFVFS